MSATFEKIHEKGVVLFGYNWLKVNQWMVDWATESNLDLREWKVSLSLLAWKILVNMNPQEVNRDAEVAELCQQLEQAQAACSELIEAGEKFSFEVSGVLLELGSDDAHELLEFEAQTGFRKVLNQPNPGTSMLKRLETAESEVKRLTEKYEGVH